MFYLLLISDVLSLLYFYVDCYGSSITNMLFSFYLLINCVCGVLKKQEQFVLNCTAQKKVKINAKSTADLCVLVFLLKDK